MNSASSDAPGMARQIAETKGRPGFEDQLLSLEADTVAYSGRLKEARELSRRAMDSGERAGEKDPPAMYSATSGLREAWFGNTDEARRGVTLALRRSSSRDVLYFAALTLAYSREDAQAQALTDDLSKRFPEDTIVQFNYLPTLRAKLALDKGNASEAIESLRAAAPYELGVVAYDVPHQASREAVKGGFRPGGRGETRPDQTPEWARPAARSLTKISLWVR
jgi:eukaryotic-like serine/threonine-protein kinase